MDSLIKGMDTRFQFLQPEDCGVRVQLIMAQEAADLPYETTRPSFLLAPYRVEDPADAPAVIDWLKHSVRKAYRSNSGQKSKQDTFDCSLGVIDPAHGKAIRQQLLDELGRRGIGGVEVDISKTSRPVTKDGWLARIDHHLTAWFTLSD